MTAKKPPPYVDSRDARIAELEAKLAAITEERDELRVRADRHIQAWSDIREERNALRARMKMYDAATMLEFGGRFMAHGRESGAWWVSAAGCRSEDLTRDAAVARAYELSKRKESEG